MMSIVHFEFDVSYIMLRAIADILKYLVYLSPMSSTADRPQVAVSSAAGLAW